MCKIGFERDTYAEKKQFLGTIADGIEFIRVKSSPYGNYPALLNADERFQSSYVDDRMIDAVHYFNQINYGNTPFVTTYETCLPRYWNEAAFIAGCNNVASSKCLKIIAISENARLVNEYRLRVVSDSIKKIIRSKNIVLHPPQCLIANDSSRFSSIDELRIVFVGRDFYIKGGVSCLLALKILVNAGYKIILTIIGDVRNINHSYNVTGATNETVSFVLKFITENRSWINWIPSLTNKEVLESLAQCHVGLLPSISETYGYVVLEMQAAGVPVITTDIRAFPEINPDECGWRIPIPKLSSEKLHSICSIIKNSIVLIVKDIFEKPDLLAEKSKASQERVRKEHSPECHAKMLKQIYLELL